MKEAILWVAMPAVYLVACAFASALLAYPLHFIIPVDFHSLLIRLGQGLLLLGLIPLGRHLGMGRAEVGWAGTGSLLRRQLLLGFGVGALTLGLHVAALLALDVRDILPDRLQPPQLLRWACKGLLVGIAIALIEESMFRGFLLGILSRKFQPLLAVLISAFYFAALHFVRTQMRPKGDEIHWDSGIAMAKDALAHLAQAAPDSFLALFAAGLFLGCARMVAPASGLSLSIGMHIGWIFVLRSSMPWSIPNFLSPWAGLISPFDGIIGYLSAAWTLLLTLPLAFLIARRQALGITLPH